MTTNTSAPTWAEYLPLWDEPVAEGLQGASCHPACKAIAVCAARACARGWNAVQWHQDLVGRHHEQWDLKLIDQAMECMRASGLWPWNAG